MDPIEAIPQETAAFGQRGVIVETGTTAITGISAYAIQVLSTATFATLTELQATGDAMTGFAIDPTIIYGDFTAVTLTSGAIRIYLK
jgi:hypothetical protein